MAVKITCDVCQEELAVPGAILYGPPFFAAGAGTARIEQTLCEQCYISIQELVTHLRTQQKTSAKQRDPDVPPDIVLIGLRKTTKSHVQKELQREGFVVEVVVFEPRATRLENFAVPPGTLVVGLKKDPALIQLVRQQSTSLGDKVAEGYFDRGLIQSELSLLEKLCAGHGWPIVDVSRRPFRDTAAEITELYRRRDETGRMALQSSAG